MSTATATVELESFNPATGELVGAVPATAPEDVQGVVDAVAAVQPAWAARSLEERGAVLKRVAQVVLDESEEIRDLLVREQGKPRNEAFSMEILPTVGKDPMIVLEDAHLEHAIAGAARGDPPRPRSLYLTIVKVRRWVDVPVRIVTV